MFKQGFNPTSLHSRRREHSHSAKSHSLKNFAKNLVSLVDLPKIFMNEIKYWSSNSRSDRISWDRFAFCIRKNCKFLCAKIWRSIWLREVARFSLFSCSSSCELLRHGQSWWIWLRGERLLKISKKGKGLAPKGRRGTKRRKGCGRGY